MESDKTSVRKALTKKTRFEVFKRDSFTCQYCGRSSPDVILNADHILPVSEGGTNEILNLLTACFECNAGKSDRKLGDDAVIKKQIDQLKELSSRREQIQMIADWRKGLASIDLDALVVVENLLFDGFRIELSDDGRRKFRVSIKKYGLASVLEAIEKSSNQYLFDLGDEACVEKFLDYTHRICYWQELQKTDPSVSELSKICGIATKRLWRVSRSSLFLKLKKLNAENGIPFSDLKELVLGSTGIMAFESAANDYLGIGNGSN